MWVDELDYERPNKDLETIEKNSDGSEKSDCTMQSDSSTESEKSMQSEIYCLHSENFSWSGETASSIICKVKKLY